MLYLIAVAVSAPVAVVVGVSPLEPVTIHVEQAMSSRWSREGYG